MNREDSIQRPDFRDFYRKYTNRLTEIMNELALEPIEHLIDALLTARANRKRIFVLGNGGSAATASHFANDFSKHRFKDSSLTFRVMSLTDNMSWISATANDEGFENVFINQLKNHMDPGDVVIALSSSGESPNVVNSVRWANNNGGFTFGIVGFNGGAVADSAHHTIYIPTKRGQYGFHEDISIMLTHVISIFLQERDCCTSTRR